MANIEDRGVYNIDVAAFNRAYASADQGNFHEAQLIVARMLVRDNLHDYLRIKFLIFMAGVEKDWYKAERYRYLAWKKRNSYAEKLRCSTEDFTETIQSITNALDLLGKAQQEHTPDIAGYPEDWYLDPAARLLGLSGEVETGDLDAQLAVEIVMEQDDLSGGSNWAGRDQRVFPGQLATSMDPEKEWKKDRAHLLAVLADPLEPRHRHDLAALRIRHLDENKIRTGGVGGMGDSVVPQ